jgi:hypothetical protein
LLGGHFLGRCPRLVWRRAVGAARLALDVQQVILPVARVLVLELAIESEYLQVRAGLTAATGFSRVFFLIG